MTTVRVVLPYHLRNIAKVSGEVTLEISGPITLGTVLDELERTLPTLRGTFREHNTGKRRPFIRYFACQEDLSHEALATALPPAICEGREPLLIVGAMAGG